jgi:protein-tyrosine-phosphatase/DNA-binding HxlR family transcriptional regulator
VVKHHDTLRRRAEMFAALGDPTRLAIAEALVCSDRTPGELIDLTGVTSALLAHHLDVLEAAGVVIRSPSHADGRKRFVRLVPRHLNLFSLTPPPNDVVFVCTHNSARSQLAAALWTRATGRRAKSAGTYPADAVHPGAIAVAHDHGIDLRSARPRLLGRVGASATVITVCDQAHDELARPTERLHWSVADPVRLGTAKAFNQAFAALEERIEYLSGSPVSSTTSTRKE